jgi:uncharacterized protein (TIGR03437 family)
MWRGATVLPLLFTAVLFGQTVETIPFRAVLSSANESQPPPAQTTGAATLWFHVVRNASGDVVSGSVDASVSYNFSSPGTITAMHIHRGDAATNGPVVVPFAVSRTDANGPGTLPVAQTTFPSNAVPLDTIKDILANPGQYYYNVHSTDAPAGVMRGQLQPAEMIVRMAMMIPENETPPVIGKSWAATGTLVLLVTRDQGTVNSAYAIFDVAYRGFPDDTAFTGMHVHSGAAQAAGPVVINSGLRGPVSAAGGGAGVLHYEAEVDLNAAGAFDAVNGAINNPSQYYMNVHTSVHPGGAVRGQLMRTDKMEFQVDMKTSNEVPPVTGLDASAPAKITAYTTRGTGGAVTAGAVVFDVNPAFPADTQFTGLHIHDGAAGTNGSVTIDSRLSAFPILVGSSGAGNIYRLATVGAGAGLATLNSMVKTPYKQYVNLHTTVDRGGAVRAQLGTMGQMPDITSVDTGIANAGGVRLSPGSPFQITGTWLANVATDLSGFADLRVLPASLNGVSVSIGGVAAGLTAVSPTAVRGQVPYSISTGDQPLIVTTPDGVSQMYIVRIERAAPAILYTFGGAVAVFDRSGNPPVTQSNPAKAGDVIIVSVVGLGQTTPPLGNGVVVPANIAYNASDVEARIGGVNTTVLAAKATPGQTGVYNVWIRVPDTFMSGNAPMLLNVGLTVSNVVALPVQ